MKLIMTAETRNKAVKHLHYALTRFTDDPSNEGWRKRTVYLARMLQQFSPQTAREKGTDKLRQQSMVMREQTLSKLQVRTEQVREAHAVQYELVERFFPDLPKRDVMHLDNDECDVRAGDGLLKLGNRAFQSPNALRFVVLHALIHYASGDRYHGDAFLALEAKMGLLGTTKDLKCWESGKTGIEYSQVACQTDEVAEPVPVEEGVELKHLRLRMNQLFGQYRRLVGNRNVKGNEQVDKIFRVWIALQAALTERRDLISAAAWEWVTEDDLISQIESNGINVPKEISGPQERQLTTVGALDYSPKGTFRPRPTVPPVTDDATEYKLKAINNARRLYSTGQRD